jgi:DNA polymerase I-like protein with 3'-5' exonuclease and polymerase domains
MARFTDIGMFWEDRPARRGQEKTLGPMPEIPETGWRPPTSFPNLTAAKVIGFDTETKDLNLRKSGPGWGRKDGHIIGVSLAVEDGTSWYFPIRHEVQPELNMDADQVMRFVAHTLKDNRPKVGANLIYDVGWLADAGIPVGGKLYDIQFAEALLDSEAPDVSLDSLAHKYLGMGKTTSLLYDWLALWLGGAANERQRANLYRSPITLAGPYAEADAALPIHILGKQWPAMAQRGVLDLFDLECRLIPLLVKMRIKGAPVNTARAEELYDTLGKDADAVARQMSELAGMPVNPAARDSMIAAFRRLGIPLPVKKDKHTKEEKVSFSADLLESVDHPLGALAVEHRQLLKVRNTFVKSYIIDKHVRGRIHCSFHPLKNDDSGARSGRFSSSDPNLQNIPSRTELGLRVRQAFESHSGARWRKFDYSQIEYRLLAHHAVGQGSEELRHTYALNADIDYHEIVQDLIRKLTGLELPRSNVKTINFGLIYGMSQPELARRLKLDRAGGASLFASYHRAAPFAKETMDAAAAEAHEFGYVTTLLGRKSDFNLWAPKDGYGLPGLSYGKAVLEYGPNVARAFTHKALNRKLQGGAADIMKKAMVDAYEAGLFEEDACGIPILTVHDELDFEDFGPLDAPCWKEFARVAETCVDTRVPIRIDSKAGANWRDAE